MVHRATQSLLAVALATLSFAAVAFAPAPARASTYDLIFADSIEVVAGPAVSGFSTGNDIALIVNTGPTNIGQAELSGATFEVTSSDPTVDGQVSILNSASPVTPILPLEAVGTMLAGSPLLTKVLPGETARNVFPIGVFWLATGFPVGYEGTVVFNVTMTMGIDVVHYFILMNVHQGPESQITVVHADRAHSQSFPTAARASTWGAIKKLYR